MVRMIHPNVTETVDVADEKAAVYAQQGWVNADQAVDADDAAEEVTAVTRKSASPAKKTAAKKSAKKK